MHLLMEVKPTVTRDVRCFIGYSHLKPRLGGQDSLPIWSAPFNLLLDRCGGPSRQGGLEKEDRRGY